MKLPSARRSGGGFLRLVEARQAAPILRPLEFAVLRLREICFIKLEIPGFFPIQEERRSPLKTPPKKVRQIRRARPPLHPLLKMRILALARICCRFTNRGRLDR